MIERLKKIARIGIAAGLAVGGAVQTGEILHQREQIHSLEEENKEQRIDILDLQNDTCWDFQLLQALGMQLGFPPIHIEDCDTTHPRGRPQKEVPPVPSGSQG